MKRIYELVQQLVKDYNTNDPFILCEELNITYIICNLHPDIHGIYQRASRYSLIFINRELSTEDKYKVCSHELGHALLHADINNYFLMKSNSSHNTSYENDAEEFSKILLQYNHSQS
ncbi:ImmA/IrrE family metallo-endopeptidase [Clostridium paraputrificum]|uniref:ImmA/IrrE family metallo-endopeptidase n=1 Tax=Clostridium paraputrificum TaxID=29363 RepID=UPI0034A157ED